jgi:hypothetical protein
MYEHNSREYTFSSIQGAKDRINYLKEIHPKAVYRIYKEVTDETV